MQHPARDLVSLQFLAEKRKLTAIATVSIPLFQSRRDRIDLPVSPPLLAKIGGYYIKFGGYCARG